MQPGVMRRVWSLLGPAVCPWAMYLTSLSLLPPFPPPMYGEAASVLRAEVRSEEWERGGESAPPKAQSPGPIFAAVLPPRELS